MHWLIISKINVDRFQLDNSLKSAPPPPFYCLCNTTVATYLYSQRIKYELKQLTFIFSMSIPTYIQNTNLFATACSNAYMYMPTEVGIF